jgi:hypothetical protein
MRKSVPKPITREEIGAQFLFGLRTSVPSVSDSESKRIHFVVRDMRRKMRDAIQLPRDDSLRKVSTAPARRGRRCVRYSLGKSRGERLNGVRILSRSNGPLSRGGIKHGTHDVQPCLIKDFRGT